MQELAFLLSNNASALVFLCTVLGLLVGSFLNVVIYRVPIMMERGWRCDCKEFLELEIDKADREPFNLVFPHSRCPHCQTPIKPYQNIPVISYLFLRGKCAQCQGGISIRYPLIEAFTGLCSAIVALHFGYGIALVCALVLTWALIALSFIDIDKQLLPDSIVLPLLWLGLLMSLYPVFIEAEKSIMGAVVGYLSLWSVYHLFKIVTGKEGMGYGDFKLLALLGAWMGWQFIPMIILLSSLVGAVIGIAMILFAGRDHHIPIPFGPYLAAAGWLAFLWGKEILAFYFQTVGL
jgi:leader peptidase (prepilin peptidase) / N-methyltransferase